MFSQYFYFKDIISDNNNIPNMMHAIPIVYDIDFLSFISESISLENVSNTFIFILSIENDDQHDNLEDIEDEEKTTDNYFDRDSTFSSDNLVDGKNEFINDLPSDSQNLPSSMINTPRDEKDYNTNENDENVDTWNTSNNNHTSSENHFENERENRYGDGESAYSDYNYNDESDPRVTPLPSDSDDPDNSNTPPESPTNRRNLVEDSIVTQQLYKSLDVEKVEEYEDTNLEDGINIPLPPPRSSTNKDKLEFVCPNGKKTCAKMGTIPAYGEIGRCFKCKEYFDKNRLFKFVESGSKCKNAVSQGLICLRCSINFNNKQLQDWETEKQQTCDRCNKVVSKRKYSNENKTCSFCLLKARYKRIKNILASGKKEKKCKIKYESDEDYEEYKPQKKIAKN